jgi:hypothetical protein
LTLVNRLIKELGEDMAPLKDVSKLDLFVATINKRLSDFSLWLELRKRRAVELDERVYWVLCSNKQDKVALVGAGLSEKELMSFKTILRFLARHKKGNVMVKDIKDRCEKSVNPVELVAKLCEHQWLVASGEGAGVFTAGIRTLVELDKALLDLGAVKCTLNNSAVLRTDKYKDWFKKTTGKDFVEEEAEGAGEDDESSDGVASREEEPAVPKAAPPAKAKGKARRALEDFDEEAEGEGQEQEPGGARSDKGKGRAGASEKDANQRRSGRAGKQRRSMREESEEEEEEEQEEEEEEEEEEEARPPKSKRRA